jgi:hypothetical protein
MRAVRTSRFKYILNLHPELAFRTHIDRAQGRDGKEYWDTWVERARNDPRALQIVRRYYKRPEEELYDCLADPHETTNLAGKGEFKRVLSDLRARVKAWMDGMNDKGEIFGVPRPLDKEELPVSF